MGSKWGELIAKHSLHDVHEAVCGETPPTTRLGGKTCIDFMVATEGVLPYIRAADYRSLHKAVVLDHILLWADIDMKAYFGGEGPSITPPQGKEFSLENIKMRKKNSTRTQNYSPTQTTARENSGSFNRMRNIRSHHRKSTTIQ